jgi:hypothetical protein
MLHLAIRIITCAIMAGGVYSCCAEDRRDVPLEDGIYVSDDPAPPIPDIEVELIAPRVVITYTDEMGRSVSVRYEVISRAFVSVESRDDRFGP